MSDLISRQAAIDAICEHGTELERRGITVLSVANHKQVTVDLLENLPSAERHGKWIDPEDSTCYKCSVCGEYATQEYGLTEPLFWHYCPNCGAKMDEGTE